jgi:peptide/nickel transport system permease protein
LSHILKGQWKTIVVDGAVVVSFLLLVLIPFGLAPEKIELSNMLGLPSFAHPLGTDNLGRDLLLRISSAITGGVLPLWLGVIVGSLGGALLAIVMTLSGQYRMATPITASTRAIATVIAAIPVGVVAFGWAAVQQKAGIIPVLVSLSTLFAVRTYLQICDLYSHDKRLGYWEAHASMGGSLAGRVWRYGIKGEWKWALLESLGFHLRAAVAIEASLSYLGFGLQEPQASFGNMLASHFDVYLKGNWTILIIIVITLAVSAAFPVSCANLLRRRRPIL